MEECSIKISRLSDGKPGINHCLLQQLSIDLLLAEWSCSQVLHMISILHITTWRQKQHIPGPPRKAAPGHFGAGLTPVGAQWPSLALLGTMNPETGLPPQKRYILALEPNMSDQIWEHSFKLPQIPHFNVETVSSGSYSNRTRKS